MSASPETGRGFREVMPDVFAALFGAFLGLSLLKFVNPPILDRLVSEPASYREWLVFAWPLKWGHWLLAVVGVVGLLAARIKRNSPWLVAALPGAWFIWEMLAGTQTVDAGLTRATLIHFATCVLCFYLGMFALTNARGLGMLWVGLLTGFGLVLLSGFFQHFGGLEATRRYAELYTDPASFPPELKARYDSNRIFATLFYPNSLAGALLLFLPISLGAIGSLRTQFTAGARGFLMAVVLAAGLACLYWSGSKGGWLLMLLLGLVYVLMLPISRRTKTLVAAAALILGLAGFAARYAGYFEKGATSVVARGDYWRGAIKITENRPVFGAGPGTFGRTYSEVKSPDAEPTHLAHNDYLEQACDSGIPGFVLYLGAVPGLLAWSYFRLGVRPDRLELAVWLGLLGWALHSLIEFHLYIPALAWPAFAFLGWLVGSGSIASTDTPGRSTMRTA